jgi:uncharacterized protein YdeI (YjbR/CyaY-like superfamily)
MNPKVDAYLRKAERWQPEIEKLREIILDCGLTEELKWKIPCYTLRGKNIVGIHGLKESCALAFFKGALLSDPKGILAKAGENSQVGRWIKFTHVGQIAQLEPVLKTYIGEAMEVENAGLKVRLKTIEEHKVPTELQARFDKQPALKKAFRALTPGRQRGYLLYFAAAKQSATRVSRIEKYIPRILEGKGMTDDYLAAAKKKR